jgi:hypothetical protein
MSVRAVVLLLASVTSGFCLWSCWGFHARNRDFTRLLGGDADVVVTKVLVEGQGRRCVLDDPASVDYLTRMLHSAERDEADLGSSYYLTAELSTGRSVKCALYVPERKDHLTLGFPIDSWGDATMYLVTLQEPVPTQLSVMLSRLRRVDRR